MTKEEFKNELEELYKMAKEQGEIGMALQILSLLANEGGKEE